MNSIISKFVAVWLHPWQTMESVKQEGENASIGSSMIFVVVMGLLSGIITSVFGMFLPNPALAGASKAAAWLAAPMVPLVLFISSFISAFFIWALVDGILRGTVPQYKTSYRLWALVSAFSPASSLLSPIPKVGQWLGILIFIWGTVVMIRGIIIIRDTPPVRTWVTCGVLFAFLFSLGLVARMAAQRQLGTNPGEFGEFGAGEFGAATDDLGEASDKLEEQLKELTEKAKADQPKK
ncbi:MAG: hypothetical protein KCHDKBKB_01195 [Elusimicrobia bacterium]|nr:hypothetical protein [Elusimicrobiota bacterium]